MTKQAQKERAEAIEALKPHLKLGTTVYTVLRHRSASGMSRRIDIYVIENNKPVYLTYWVAKLLGIRVNQGNKEGLIVGGCGMDVGFEVVYNAGRVLFPEGFIPAEAGRSYGRNGTPATELDKDGGYALNHQWI